MCVGIHKERSFDVMVCIEFVFKAKVEGTCVPPKVLFPMNYYILMFVVKCLLILRTLKESLLFDFFISCS